MQMTEPMVLPVDLLILPVQDLPEHVRQQVKAEEGDFALTRPNSRTPSRIIDAAAADLLKEFRSPVTIVEAVIRYSRERKIDPEQTLEEAYPLLERLAGSHLLVPSSSDEAKKIQASLEVPSRFMEFDVVRCLQSLDDTELYQLKSEDGQFVALKLGRSDARDHALRMFDREEAMLTRLHGESTPRLLRSGKSDNGQRYLIMEWCPGQDCAIVAAHLRSQVGMASRRRLLALCSSILEAYVRLHQKNVIHSDIHPRNVLIDDSGDPNHPRPGKNHRFRIRPYLRHRARVPHRPTRWRGLLLRARIRPRCPAQKSASRLFRPGRAIRSRRSALLPYYWQLLPRLLSREGRDVASDR